MDTVYKYGFDIFNVSQEIEMPYVATPLRVGLDPHGMPSIWMRVDTDSIKSSRTVYVVGTGHPIPIGAETYVGSFNQDRFVWHVFID